MRHFVADNAEAITDGLRGFCAVNADLVALGTDPRLVVRATPKERGVAVVSGGGSGHEPLHAGFVGEGMLDAAVPGEVFASPSAEQVIAAMRAVDTGDGVVQVIKNYTGDVINFTMAADECRAAGMQVESVLVDDDVPSGVRGEHPGRRGTVATVVVEKVCGAAAEAGRPLAEVAELGRRVVDRARSIGAAQAAGTGFGGEQAFDLPDNEVEYGVGIHGERGTDRLPDEGLEKLVGRMVDDLLDDLDAEGPLLVIMNGLGSTTPLELHAAMAHALDALGFRELEVARALVGDLVTSLDMRGLSLTVVAMDDELLELWDAPVMTSAWRGVRLDGRPATKPRQAPCVDGSLGGDDPGAHRDEVRAWVDAFADVAEDKADELGELDRKAGDGDFGDNLRTAVGRYREREESDALVALAAAYASIGGTSGPLYALWFRTLGREAAAWTPEGIAAGLEQATGRVRELGGASPGDKTMVDAMVPAAEAARHAVDAGKDVREVLAAAADAALEGAERTAETTASKGRASYVGEVGRGVADPGALVVAYFLRAGSGIA
ncbi:dihydroxyacetone kinase family protein [Mariniluteicoccus endophyticus]